MKRLDEFGLTPEQVDAVRAVVYAWNCRDLTSGALMTPQHYATGEPTDDACPGIGPGWWASVRQMPRDGTASAMVYLGYGWTESHSIRDYAKAIRVGFGGIRREVEALLKSADLADPDYPRKENFWRAALSICDAGCRLGRRYAETAAALAAKTDDAGERARLTRMAEVCARVPRHPARTFHEALQSMLFLHNALCLESYENAISFGRLDQILYPYYRMDLEEGRITPERALELLCLFILKMDEVVFVSDGSSIMRFYRAFETITTDQTLTFVGVDREGRDATNDVTYMLLDACELQPRCVDPSARVHEGSPARYLERLAEVDIGGCPMPKLNNDAVDRGYERMETKHSARGASVERVPGD